MRKRCYGPFQRYLGTLGAALLALLAGPPSGATCGSSYCFLETGTGEGLQAKGAFRIDFSYQFVNQSRKLAGSDDVAEVLTPKISFEEGELEPDHHREIRTLNTLLHLDAIYSVTDRLSIEVHLPLVNDRDHEHFDEVGTPEEFFTREDGSSGFGDVRLGVRYGVVVGTRNLVSAQGAIKLPTGSHTQRDSEGEINEPTIQPGTGSTDFLAGVRWSHQIQPRQLETFVSLAHRVNTENDLDYQFGDESVLSGGFRQRLDDRWSWSAQLNARHTGRDRSWRIRRDSGGSLTRVLGLVGIIRGRSGRPGRGHRVGSVPAVGFEAPCARAPFPSTRGSRGGTSGWSPRTRARARVR